MVIRLFLSLPLKERYLSGRSLALKPLVLQPFRKP